MIRVIGANPAMDRISTWPPLRLGEVNRAVEATVVPGGKGFNVARGVIRLGSPVTAYGYLGGHVGQQLRDMVVADGVIDRHTTIEAGTRVCFIVVEPDSGRATVLNEPGPSVTEEETQGLLSTLRDDCAPGDLVVLSGSLPDSASPGIAGEIVDIGNRAGARTIVDIHSEALTIAARHRPWMLKCNRLELLGLLGASQLDPAPPLSELGRQMQQLCDGGIEVVVVSLGSDGVLVADKGGVTRALVPAIEVVNATGSGDLLLAGLIVGIERGLALGDAAALGAACGTAGATHLAPELPSDFVASEWLSRITLQPQVPAS
jgi:1-phosphofructokinase family hexose kinase